MHLSIFVEIRTPSCVIYVDLDITVGAWIREHEILLSASDASIEPTGRHGMRACAADAPHQLLFLLLLAAMFHSHHCDTA